MDGADHPVGIVPAPLAPSFSWRDRWVGTRNRLIESPTFQRWAIAFPLTRPIARRHAAALFDLVAGFVYSQILTASLKLGLFEILAEGPQTVAVLARRLGLDHDAAERLLKAAAALRLVEVMGEARYGLGLLGAALRGNPGVAAMIAHHAMLYEDLADPVALLRRGGGETTLGRFWSYAASPDPTGAAPASVAGYSALMADSQAMVAREVLDAYPLRRHRRLLDIGGGEGVFLAAAAARWPQLELMLFDLPAVVARAGVRLTAAGLAGRTTLSAGSFHGGALPSGADIATLVRVLHDHDDAAALAILCRARAALPAGGVLLIAEPMAGTRGARAMGDAYFGFYLAAMGSGRPRTPAELTELLRRAGFRRTRKLQTRMPLVVSVIAAYV